MPFPSPLSNDNLTRLRASGYRSSQYLAYCPQTVVFRARASAGVVSGVFGSLGFTSVDVGAYTDIKEGQTVYLSLSTSIRNAYHIGRVRKSATSNTLYISESAVVVQPNDYIIVVNDYWLHEILGRVDGTTVYADYDKPFAKLKPIIRNLQSAYVNPVASGSASFSFAPLASAMTHSATISSWSWSVGDGTITTGTSTSQNITASFPQGERWVRLTVTDSNGVSNFMVFWVCVGMSYIIDNIEQPDISVEIGVGYKATVNTFYVPSAAVLKSLPDNTLCVLFSTEIFGDDSSTPILTNIDFIGRTRQEQSATTGDELYGQLQTANLTLEGIGYQLVRLSCPQISVEDKATPTAYGEITRPTPPRAISYLCSVFNTLSNICSLSFGDDDNDYVVKSLPLQATSAWQSIQEIANYINAQICFAPSGEIAIRRQAFYLSGSDKSALDTIAQISGEDMESYSIERDYFKAVGQAITAGENYSTSAGSTSYHKGAAPQTARGNGEEIVTSAGEILPADSTEGEANTEIALRTGVFYTVSQPLEVVDATFYGSWRNLFVPTPHQWWTADIPSADNARGLIYNSNTRLILISATQSSDIETGVRVIQAKFIKEPVTAAAQVMATIIPEVTAPTDPVIPAVNPYSGFPPDPLTFMPSDTPTAREKSRFPIVGGFSPFNPLPANEQTEASGGNIGCKTFNVFFSNPSSVYTGFLTQNGSPYVITVSGDAQISSGEWVQHFDFTTQSHSDMWSILVGSYSTGVGYVTGDVVVSGPVATRQIFLKATFPAATTTTSITMTFDYTEGTFTRTEPAWLFFKDGALFASRTNAEVSTGNNQTYSWNGSTAFNNVTLSLLTSYDHTSPQNSYDGAATLKSATLRGTGTNPFTGVAGTVLRGDAFYYGYDSGSPVAYESSQGLRIDGTPVATIPTYSPNHEYTIIKNGTGNQFQFNFADTNYADNQNSPLRVEVCGENTG